MIVPPEIVASVLSNISNSKKYLPTELRRIHPVFYKILKDHPELLAEFHFDQRGTFPYSSVIDEAFCNLEAARVLPKVNPDLDKYEITSRLRKYYETHIEEQINPELLEEIKKIAHELEAIAEN